MMTAVIMPQVIRDTSRGQTAKPASVHAERDIYLYLHTYAYSGGKVKEGRAEERRAGGWQRRAREGKRERERESSHFSSRALSLFPSLPPVCATKWRST